jgi:hypothetical protein
MGIGMSEMAILLAFPFFLVPSLPIGVPPQEADPLLSRVAPEECLFYFVSNGMGTPDPESKNRTEQMFADPEVQRTIALFRTALQETMAQSDLDPADAKLLQGDLITTPMCAVIESVKIDPDAAPDTPSDDIQGYILLKTSDAKNYNDFFVRQLKKSEAKLVTETIGGETFHRYQYKDSPHIYFGSKGQYLIVGFGKGSVEKLFANARTTEPKWLTEAREKVTVERLGTFTYVNVAGFLEDVDAVMPPEVKEYLEISGISSTETLLLSTGLNKTEFESRLLVDTGGKYEGIYKLFDQDPLTEADLAAIPADSLYWGAMNVDLTKGEDTLLDLVATAQHITKAEAKDAINEQMEGAGLNLSDTLALLKGAWVSYQPPESGLFATDAVTTLSSPDPKRLSDIVASSLSAAWSSDGDANGPNAGPGFYRGPQARIIDKKYRDNDYRIFKLGGFFSSPLTPSWGVINGKFAYSNTPQGIRSAARAPKAEKPVTADATVAAMLAEEPVMLASVDTRTLIPAVVMGLQAIVLAGETQDFPEALDISLLPPPRTLLKYIRPARMSLQKHPEGLMLTLSESYPTLMSPGSIPVAAALLLPAVDAARKAAQRVASTNNLKQIALAVHMYHTTHGKLPADIVDEEGKPLLSWRVQLLPYLEQQALYDAMKLDEPWDSEHNIKFAETIIATYQSPGYENTTGKTYYQAIKNGNGMIVTPTKGDDGKVTRGLSFADVKDGMSNTAMVAEVAEPVVWSKPADFVPDEKDAFKGLSSLRDGVILMAFGDGSVQAVSDSIDPETLKAIFTRSGGEIVGDLSGDGHGAHDHDHEGFPIPEESFPDEDFSDEGFPEDLDVESGEELRVFPDAVPQR